MCHCHQCFFETMSLEDQYLYYSFQVKNLHVKKQNDHCLYREWRIYIRILNIFFYKYSCTNSSTYISLNTSIFNVKGRFYELEWVVFLRINFDALEYWQIFGMKIILVSSTLVQQGFTVHYIYVARFEWHTLRSHVNLESIESWVQ